MRDTDRALQASDLVGGEVATKSFSARLGPDQSTRVLTIRIPRLLDYGVLPVALLELELSKPPSSSSLLEAFTSGIKKG